MNKVRIKFIICILSICKVAHLRAQRNVDVALNSAANPPKKF